MVDPYQPVSLDETVDFVHDPVRPFMSLPTVSFTSSTLSDFDIEETAIVDEILANGVTSLGFGQSAMFEENNEPSTDVIWTVKCLLLEVDRNIKNDTLSGENKKPTTAFRSKEDISAKNLMKYKVLSPCEHTHNTICQKDLIEETRRCDINLVFSTKSFDERNTWMDSNLSISQIEGSKKI